MRIRLSSARNALAAAGLAIGLAVTFAAPAATAAPVTVPDDKVVIDVVTADGSGCKPGTKSITVAPDNTAFTITYNDYSVEVGPATASLIRKNCQLTLWVHVPQGLTYAIAKADFRGFASLAPGATAIQKASYYFQGDSTTVSGSHSFAGPYGDNWQTTDQAEIGALVYAPCGAVRYFNVNSELRVSKGTSNSHSTSSITMDSTDGSISTIYQFHWKQCPTP
jgi:hypothetical protein